MIKGGYKIVNFNGTALSGTAVELSGIYDQIVDDYDKSIMVSGVSLNGKLQDDAYADVQEKTAQDLSKSVELTVYGGIITVTEDDEVSFVLSKTTAELTAEIGDLEGLETTEKSSVVGAINELTTNTAGTSVNLSDYTSSEPYVTSSDGYVVINSQTASSGYIRVVIQSSNSVTVGQLYMNVTGVYQAQTMYVRKGMKVYLDASTASGATVAFKPLS